MFGCVSTPCERFPGALRRPVFSLYAGSSYRRMESGRGYDGLLPRTREDAGQMVRMLPRT